MTTPTNKESVRASHDYFVSDDALDRAILAAMRTKCHRPDCKIKHRAKPGDAVTAIKLLVDKAVIAGRIEELESLELYWTPERWNEYKKLLPKSQHKDAKNSVFFNGAINYILKDRLSDLKAQIVSKETNQIGINNVKEGS